MAKLSVQKEIARHVEGKHGYGNLADALTNSGLQDIAKQFKRQGLRGGLRDSRKLRAELHATIAANIGDQTAFTIVENTDFEQDRRHTVHRRLVTVHQLAALQATDKKRKKAHQNARRAHNLAFNNWGDVALWAKAMKHSIRLSILPHFYE
jgi:hypothetical protein